MPEMPEERGWRIGRIGSVQIRLDTSVWILAFLITYDLWVLLSDRFRFPDLGGGGAFGLAALTSVLFVASILAHELAHAGMFIARGIPVNGITLYMFGGLTSAKTEAKKPVDEFLVTVVGPLTTAALGGLFLLLHVAGRGFLSHPWRAVFGYLALLNLIMAAFNLLPGFPLDGGRILLSALWRLTGSRARATKMAARVGQGVALLVVAASLLLAVETGNFYNLWPALIGWMLFRSAGAALVEGERRRLLENVTVGEVMSAPPPTVDGALSLADATERYLAGHEGEAFPVAYDGRIVGFISPAMARSASPDRRVLDAMVGTDAVNTASPNEHMDQVLEGLDTRGVSVVLVMDDGKLVGVIEPEDLTRLLRSGRHAAPPRPD